MVRQAHHERLGGGSFRHLGTAWFDRLTMNGLCEALSDRSGPRGSTGSVHHELDVGMKGFSGTIRKNRVLALFTCFRMAPDIYSIP
jgi:hypothetical protein